MFNLAEGYAGRNRESYVPSLLEFLGIPHSGSDALTLAISLDKALTKILMCHHGVRTPGFSVIDCRGAVSAPAGGETPPLHFPSFLKPLREGSSKGIRQSSVVHNTAQLKKEYARYRKDYGNIPLIAENYIRGREITVGVLGTRDPKVLGLMEIRWKKNEKRDFIYPLEVKRDWRKLVKYLVPAPLAPKLRKEISEMALKAHQILECCDVSRVDFRVNEKGVPYFIEINPLPGLSPDYSDLVILARGMGMTHRELILSIFKEACRRYPGMCYI